MAIGVVREETSTRSRDADIAAATNDQTRNRHASTTWPIRRAPVREHLDARDPEIDRQPVGVWSGGPVLDLVRNVGVLHGGSKTPSMRP